MTNNRCSDFFLLKIEEKKMPIYMQWQRGKTLEKLDTLNDTTFSSRPLFNLCGAQTPTENLWFSWFFPAINHHYLKRRC